jgi:hypothetical protein
MTLLSNLKDGNKITSLDLEIIKKFNFVGRIGAKLTLKKENGSIAKVNDADFLKSFDEIFNTFVSKGLFKEEEKEKILSLSIFSFSSNLN